MSSFAEKNTGLDDIDRDILSELQRDGRQTFSDLALRVGLSANAAAERVRRLLQCGAILAIEARIAPEVHGHHLMALVDVKLRLDTPAEHLEREIAQMPQILAATLTTGSFDYTLRVGCTNQDELVSVIERLRSRAGVADTNTRLILHERIFRRPVNRRQARRARS